MRDPAISVFLSALLSLKVSGTPLEKDEVARFCAPVRMEQYLTRNLIPASGLFAYTDRTLSI